MYDPPYVHDEADQARYGELCRQVDALVSAGRNAAALRTFLRGIGMPVVFVHLLRFMPGWRTMIALAPTLAYDMALTRDLPPDGQHAVARLEHEVGCRRPARPADPHHQQDVEPERLRESAFGHGQPRQRAPLRDAEHGQPVLACECLGQGSAIAA